MIINIVEDINIQLRLNIFVMFLLKKTHLL